VDVGLTEGTAVPLEQLLPLSLEKKQLDVAVDCLPAVGRRDAVERAPLLVVLECVADDLDVGLGDWAVSGFN